MDEPFFYGEILGSAGPNFGISNYTTYMAVTDNQTGDRALDKAYWSAAGELADDTYIKGASAEKSVLWVESHDTYMGNTGSAYISNTKDIKSEVLNKAWAIVGARAGSTALFLARPNSTMGAASSDNNWKSKAVAEVNKFKNYFHGANECLSYSDNTAYIERGLYGVVISKLDGAGSVNLTAIQMADGTYTDQVSGNTFTVSNGTISGTVGSTGVAVVYDPNTQPTITLYAKNEAGWDNTCIYYWNNYGDNIWPGTPMDNFYTDDLGDKFYKITIPILNGINGVIFTDGAETNIKQTIIITENVADNAFWRISGTINNYDAVYSGIYPVTLNETDNSSVIGGLNGQTHGVTLTRTLQAGGWNTFCAPFNISSSQITSVFGSGTKVRELGSSNFDSATKELTLNFTNASSIDAGKPYLVYLGSATNVVNPTFEGVTISNSTTTMPTTYADFVPVMNPTNLEGGNKTVLFVTGGNKLTYPADDGNINGFRAYFQLKEGAAASARTFTMSFNDEEAGIEAIEHSPLNIEHSVYDLQGRRMANGQSLKKGVYIVDGKKTIIK